MAGRVGQYAAIPPGNVTPIWPSSGIALAAVLLRGSSIWPAILLGSLMVNLWVFLTQGHTSMLIRVVTSTGMGIGAYESFQYVQELGGRVQVDSTPNVGTHVRLLLPRSESGVAAAPPARKELA